MRLVHKLAAAALLAGTTAIGVSTPAAARVDVSIGIGVPGGFVGDYDYYRPCGWYRSWNIPAPYRCYREFYGFYGPDVYVVDGFVFRDRDDWGRWRDRDDWNHWRAHQFRRADWHDNGEHRGWDRRDHGDDRGDWRGHDRGDDRRDWRDHGDHGDHGDRGDRRDHGDHGDHGDHDH